MILHPIFINSIIQYMHFYPHHILTAWNNAERGYKKPNIEETIDPDTVVFWL